MNFRKTCYTSLPESVKARHRRTSTELCNASTVKFELIEVGSRGVLCVSEGATRG